MNVHAIGAVEVEIGGSYHIRIVHGELYEPTLLFVGDLCGPVEIATTPGFNYVPCIAKPTN